MLLYHVKNLRLCFQIIEQGAQRPTPGGCKGK